MSHSCDYSFIFFKKTFSDDKSLRLFNPLIELKRILNKYLMVTMNHHEDIYLLLRILPENALNDYIHKLFIF